MGISSAWPLAPRPTSVPRYASESRGQLLVILSLQNGKATKMGTNFSDYRPHISGKTAGQGTDFLKSVPRMAGPLSRRDRTVENLSRHPRSAAGSGTNLNKSVPRPRNQRESGTAFPFSVPIPPKLGSSGAAAQAEPASARHPPPAGFIFPGE